MFKLNKNTVWESCKNSEHVKDYTNYYKRAFKDSSEFMRLFHCWSNRNYHCYTTQTEAYHSYILWQVLPITDASTVTQNRQAAYENSLSSSYRSTGITIIRQKKYIQKLFSTKKLAPNATNAPCRHALTKWILANSKDIT